MAIAASIVAMSMRIDSRFGTTSGTRPPATPAATLVYVGLALVLLIFGLVAFQCCCRRKEAGYVTFVDEVGAPPHYYAQNPAYHTQHPYAPGYAVPAPGGTILPQPSSARRDAASRESRSVAR